MKELKDLLDNYTQQPPASGWERVSSRLDMLAPTGGESAGASSSSGAATGAAAKGAAVSISKGLLIAAAGLLTTAAVVTTIVKVHNAASKVQGVESSDSQPAIVLTDSTQQVEMQANEKSFPAEEAFSSDYSVTPASTADNGTAPTVSEAKPENVSKTNIPATPSAMVPTSNIVEARTETPKPAIAPKSAVSRPAITPSLPNLPLPDQSTLLRQQQEDPVVQNMNPEEMTWNQPVKIEIPNVFTPNGDGLNDNFVILGLDNCVRRELIVRNYGGNIVYHSRSYENTWNGDNCPDGIYTYHFLYNSNGIDQELVGTVRIIRK